MVRSIHAIGFGWFGFDICFESQNTSLLGKGWVDCLSLILNRHPAIADRLVAELEEPSTRFLSAAAEAARTLTGTVARGSAWSPTTPLRDPSLEQCAKVGSMHPAGGSKSTTARSCFPESQTRREHSQAGPGAGAALTALPTGNDDDPFTYSSVVCDNLFLCLSAVAHVASGWDVGSRRILPRERLRFGNARSGRRTEM